MQNDKPWDKLQAAIASGVTRAHTAIDIESRVIAVGTIKAACNDYIASHKPDGWAELGAAISRVRQDAQRKKDNERTLF